VEGHGVKITDETLAVKGQRRTRQRDAVLLALASPMA
jgi:hypothetical protein